MYNQTVDIFKCKNDSMCHYAFREWVKAHYTTYHYVEFQIFSWIPFSVFLIGKKKHYQSQIRPPKKNEL